MVGQIWEVGDAEICNDMMLEAQKGAKAGIIPTLQNKPSPWAPSR